MIKTSMTVQAAKRAFSQWANVKLAPPDKILGEFSFDVQWYLFSLDSHM